MVHTLAHEFFGILLEAFTLLLIKTNRQTRYTCYFYKSLRLNITKTWRATNEPKFKGPKNPLKLARVTMSDYASDNQHGVSTNLLLVDGLLRFKWTEMSVVARRFITHPF
jgi:hypothetical protein